jgi:CheY-like chemotaxis protein
MVSAGDPTAFAHDPQAALVDTLLVKPVSSSTLFRAVNESVVKRTGDLANVLQGSVLDAHQLRWLPGVRVLAVDDSALNLTVVRHVLEREGAQVHGCDSGQAALAWLARSDPAPCDVVLMDVQMPELSGLETTRRIRTDPGLARLPVIGLSAGALAAERNAALAAGMDDFLSKPVDPPALVRTLRLHIERVRGASLAVAPCETRSSDVVAPAAGWPAIEGIDCASVIASLGGQVGLFMHGLQALFDGFAELTNGPSHPPADADQAGALAAQLHRLRGSAGLLGAHEVTRLAGLVERQARAWADSGEPDPAGSLPRQLADLGAALARLRASAAPALQRWQALAGVDDLDVDAAQALLPATSVA